MKRSVLILFCTAISIFSGAQIKGLDYFINQSLANSPLLKDYGNQILLNRVDSLRILASYKPQVTGSSFNSYAPIIKGVGYDQSITNGGTFNTLIGVNKSIPNKKNLAAQFENLQLQNQSLSNVSQISEQDLKRTITTQYITTYGDMLQLNFNKSIDSFLTKEEIVLKKLTEQNVYRQVDYLAFLVTMQQQKLLIKQQAIQFQNDYASLNYLSGISDTAAVMLQEPDISIASLPGTENSVFFRQFLIDSLKLINNKVLVDMSYKPKINLFADAGFNSTFAYRAYNNFGTSFGFNVSVPIYDGKQRKLQYSKIAIAERTRRNYQSFFKGQYNQQIAQLMQQLNATNGLIADINDQLRYSESLIKVNEKMLVTGEVKIADYILALNSYLNAKNLITQNNINRLQIINQINYWNR
ncbi:MAG TPA: TolC family protein [Chitinophagaceae bacterium]|nr:TolC family protein [Chitinophagaceae bacterium]